MRGRAGADLQSTCWRPARVIGAVGLLAALTLGGLALGVAPLVATPAGAAASGSREPATATALAQAVRDLPAGAFVADPSDSGQWHAEDAPAPSCFFNGVATDTELVTDVTPGEAIPFTCTGWTAFDGVSAAEFSPLLFSSGSASAEIDTNNEQTFEADGFGDLSGTFIVPDPFVAADPAAACPPTPTEIADGFYRCGIVMADAEGNGPALVVLDYAGVTVPSQPLPPAGPAPAHAKAVGLASTAYGGGYWLAWSNGTVTDYGDAVDLGDASSLALDAPITHIVATPDGLGYWLVGADGGVFDYGDGAFYGSMGGKPLNRPVVDMAPTPDGRGYWLVGSDGGVFSFGDASFYGSMGGKLLNQPIVGIAADTATGGYWLVASDGGVFSFNAPFLGSTGGQVLNQPVVGLVAIPGGGGYLFVARDGGVFTYGDAPFVGSTGGKVLAAPIVGATFDPLTGGYWLAGADGGVFAFDAPFDGSA
jgi:hypothetical protein